ncbi:MAG: hypothetical protein ACD_3C00121G0001 [uncultured bacterium (gcode 4)]|uniref:Uncharacterized protein n=1 Tax=uncultured bacterium (gcode 4) TaxID=1234023 RepID=K2G165_9BACT|nr:MAG: hypothetical protein ACD_3C00121G0001 [uncultured bacterium (gcode 4)]
MNFTKDGHENLTDRKSEITSFAPKVIETVRENSQEILLEDILKYFHSEGMNISIKLKDISNREKMLSIFDVFFKYHYIEDLNYDNFQEIIYNFEEQKQCSEGLILWKKICPFSSVRRDEYKKFILNNSEYNWQLLKVECTFSRIYVESESWKEVIFDFKFDEFIAYMFSKWLRFWLDKNEICKWLWVQYYKWTIAKIKSPTTWNPSRLETLIEMKPDKKPVEVSEKENVDLKRFKCIFPQIDCNVNDWLMAIKYKPTFWSKWMQIDWRIIDWLIWEDNINLQILCWEWIETSENDTKVYIKANVSWFINAETEYHSSWIHIPTKISVSKEINYRWDIWKETQSLEITCWEKISLLWNVRKYYELIWNNIRVENWNIEWKVTSVRWNMNVFWNVINWSAIALDWNIFINWNVITSSYIESFSWDIEIDYAEYSTIIWKNVRINKKAVGCTIICDNLQAEEINACNLLIKKSVNINKLDAKFHKWELQVLKTKDTRIILLFKKDVLWNIETLKKIKRKMALYLNKDTSSPDALKKMEELNSFLAHVSEEQSIKELQINTSEYVININYWTNEEFLSIRLADFFESFDIENLKNLKWMSEKESFLDRLSQLFNEWNNDHIGKLMLWDFDYGSYTDSTNILRLDFEKIKIIILEEINEVWIIRDTKESRIDWMDRREEFRIEFWRLKFEDGKNTDVLLDEIIPIEIDQKECFLKDISVWWIWFCIDKAKISDEEQIFYQENDIVDLYMKLVWLWWKEKIFNIKLILTFRKEIWNKILFWSKFIWLRWSLDTELRLCIRKFEIESIRKKKELQKTNIAD